MLGLVLMMSCSDDLTAADINRVPSLCLKELRCLTPQADFKLLLYGLDSLPNEQPTPIPYLERTLVQTVSQQASPDHEPVGFYSTRVLARLYPRRHLRRVYGW